MTRVRPHSAFRSNRARRLAQRLETAGWQLWHFAEGCRHWMARDSKTGREILEEHLIDLENANYGPFA